ncbi:hypothetical protein BC938DRAFT_479032 [Jimgerdemannia flammicorona]|uniref:Uncharacterized protein n=1 Tax=Jimgerdemannia flammicorona TaxID=994334 RepID=A0A433QLT3_9FUNG|nr:hypothetical protein BC938DRAFT_479032 [Jimgerdemannia flammicorona]
MISERVLVVVAISRGLEYSLCNSVMKLHAFRHSIDIRDNKLITNDVILREIFDWTFSENNTHPSAIQLGFAGFR